MKHSADGKLVIDYEWTRQRYNRSHMKLEKYIAEEILGCNLKDANTQENKKMLDETCEKFGNPFDVIPQFVQAFDEKIIRLRDRVYDVPAAA